MFSSRGLFGEMFSSHGLFSEMCSSHGLFGEMFEGIWKHLKAWRGRWWCPALTMGMHQDPYHSIWKHDEAYQKYSWKQFEPKSQENDPRNIDRPKKCRKMCAKFDVLDKTFNLWPIFAKKKTLSSYFGMRQSPWALGGAQVAPFGGKTPGFVSIPRPWPRRTRAQRVSWLNCNDWGPTQGGEPPGGQPWPA